MKQVTTILAILVGFTMNAQLQSVTENSKTGQRLTVSLAANHGDIGSNAVDLSYSDGGSNTRGATGTASTAMGYKTTASGDYSTAIGDYNRHWYSVHCNWVLYNRLWLSFHCNGGSAQAATDYASLSIGRYNSVNKSRDNGG